MALTRAKKAQKVEALAAELQGSTTAIIGTFAKLTVSQDFELRQKVREAGGRYRVVKNKLASRASKGTAIEGALQGLKGVSSVAYTSGDPVALAKVLSAWVKENAEFTFKLGIVDGKLINVEEVQALATMPGKEEIFAKLLFLINAPAQRLATVLAATGRDIAVVVNQAVEQNKFTAAPSSSGPTAAAPSSETSVPTAEAAAPAVGSATPAVESVESAAPAVEAAEPAAETAAPVAGAAAPAAEDAVPVEGATPAASGESTQVEVEIASETPAETQAEAASSEAPVEGEAAQES